MDIFRRSTRSIVTKGRPKDTAADPGAPLDPVWIDVDAIEAAGSPNTHFEENVIMSIKNLPKWAYWAAGGAALVVLVIMLICILPKPAAPYPEVPSGQVIAAVDAEPALTAQINAGDIVKLYQGNGQVIAQLQYVQVYQTDVNGGLLLYVDDLQAAALIAQETSPEIVLVARAGTEHSADLLALQERINDPDISITLQPSVTLAPGDSAVLEIQASILPEEAILPSIVWTSSAPEVAAVKNGVVTAAGVGQASITASCGDAQAVCSVTVEVPLAQIELSKQALVLGVGEAAQITAVPVPENATRFSVSWNVADPAIATVSQDGTVTAVAVGKTTVTASCADVKVECPITVGLRAEVAQLDKQSMTLTVGQKDKLTPTVYPGTDMIDKGTFESSDPAVATVANDGTVTAVAAGTVTITYRCGKAQVTCTVTVT